LNPFAKKLLGVVLAVLAGLFYGSNFDPPTYIIDQVKKGSTKWSGSVDGIDYVFSHFCGIFIASTAYFVIYCGYKRNQPFVNPQIILPGMISGVMWAIAQVGFFIANTALGFTITFPILATGPGAVGAVLGIFLFGEIKGTKNYLLLGAALSLTAVGVILITLSKNIK